MTASEVAVRAATESDLAAINEIYNHYVLHTAITFDLEPATMDARRQWFTCYAEDGRHRLFVAIEGGTVRGYADSHQFRQKRAYDTTVETTAYCAHDATGRGIGNLLYDALFSSLTNADLRLAVAAITLPNDASIALHDRFGFTLTGVMHEVGKKFDRYWDVAWYEKRLG